MAKDEIVRTAIGAAESVAVSVKQSEVNALLKKKAVEVAEKDKAHDQSADADQAAAAAAPAEASASVEVADASDALGFASDAGISPSVLLSGASAAGETGGISNTTLLVGGGVLLAGGAIAIASNSGGGGHKDPVPVVTLVAPSAASVNEGQTVNFTVTGTPGASFSWSVDAAHVTDVVTASGTIVIGPDGTGTFSVTASSDGVIEPAETFKVTVGGIDSAAVTIVDTVIPPKTYVLTTETNQIPGDGGSITGTQADHIVGVASGGNPNFETFSVGDNIRGNGFTVLDLKIADGGTEAVVQLDKIAEINIDNLAGNTQATFNASLWTDIGEINLIDGQDGLTAYFSDLERGVDFSIASGVSGSLSASFTDHLYARLYAGHDSDISWIANNVDSNVTVGESASFSLTYDDINPLDITLGTVTAVVADSATFFAGVYDQGGDGTVTVGNVLVNLGEDSTVTVSVTATDGNDGAHTIVVGNVSLLGVAASSADLIVTIDEEDAGNITVGNVVMTGFDDVDLTISRTKTSDEVVGGNVTVGNVTLSVSDSGTVDASIVNYAGSANTNGNLTVGNVTIDLGKFASGSFTVSNTAGYDDASDDVSVGDTRVGNILIDLDTSATFERLSITASASADSGSATVGDFTVGNITVNGAVNSSFSADITVNASGTGADGGIGDIQLGNLTATLNDGADFELSVNVEIEKGDVASFAAGDVLIDSSNGVSASVDLTYSLTASDGDIGPISLGDVQFIVGENADYSYTFYASAENIGNVTVGDVSAKVLTSGSAKASFSLDAVDGDIGNITFGNVALTATGESADAYAYLFASTADNIGDVNFGNVSVIAAGESAQASFEAYLTATQDVGDVTIGDVVVKASGEDAYAGFSLFASGPSDVGTVTLGDLSLTATNSADLSTVRSYLYIQTASVAGGSVVIGDVDITVKAGDNTGDATFSGFVTSTQDITIGDISIFLDADETGDSLTEGNNNFNVNVSASGDIDTGVIAVVGGDSIKDSLATFTNITGVFTAGGDVTIAGVDYSQYGADSFIDVSNVKGAGTIIGSAYDDQITDNVGKNVITGGDGDDVFFFDSGNTGKTAATADQILDWTFDDDLIDTGNTGNVAEYTEGTFASFDLFLADAESADKDHAVGLVNGNLFIAVDQNSDDAVDYVIELVGINSLNEISVLSFQ